MAYLLDSNTLIQAKNAYYAFDVVPAFWDWIEVKSQLDRVFSIDRVQAELQGHKDELATWARSQGPSVFRALDTAASSAMGRVAALVQRGGYEPQAVSHFMGGADPFLIAYALAHGHTVVSHEVAGGPSKKKIKIPTICQALNVPFLVTFEMLRLEGARFVLP